MSQESFNQTQIRMILAGGGSDTTTLCLIITFQNRRDNVLKP